MKTDDESWFIICYQVEPFGLDTTKNDSGLLRCENRVVIAVPCDVEVPHVVTSTDFADPNRRCSKNQKHTTKKACTHHVVSSNRSRYGATGGTTSTTSYHTQLDDQLSGSRK